MNLNKDEYGQTIRVNIGQDITLATDLKVIIEPQRGAKLEKTGTLGMTQVTEDDEIYLANEYIEYITQIGDLSYAGQWRAKGTAVISATENAVGDYKRFTVLE